MTIVEETGKLPIGDEGHSHPETFIDAFLDGQTQEKDSSEETQEKRKSVCAKKDSQGRQKALPPHQGAPDRGARYAASTAKEAQDEGALGRGRLVARIGYLDLARKDVGRLWSTAKIALDRVTAFLVEKGQLLLGLDALGDHVQLKFVS